jgi:tRNA-Thr(GGU) m(6)t(6)A37 methyltransferase TsaA
VDILLQPIGHVRSSRREVRDDDWDVEVASIVLDPALFTPEAVREIDSFSHIEVIYHFDRVPRDKIEYGARRPRGNEDWPKVGIFAQRAKNRPNRLGLTVCRIRRVDGLTIYVDGFDAIDDTPVLDIKPYMREFAARGDIRQPQWSTELMRGYWSS